jgi:hypothetical protein
MRNKPVRTVGVIGAGSIGYRHLKNLEKLGVDKVLVYEPKPERRAQIEAEHPDWKFYPKVADFSAETPEAVIVASPSAFHEDCTSGALCRTGAPIRTIGRATALRPKPEAPFSIVSMSLIWRSGTPVQPNWWQPGMSQPHQSDSRPTVSQRFYFNIKPEFSVASTSILSSASIDVTASASAPKVRWSGTFTAPRSYSMVRVQRIRSRIFYRIHGT